MNEESLTRELRSLRVAIGEARHVPTSGLRALADVPDPWQAYELARQATAVMGGTGTPRDTPVSGGKHRPQDKPVRGRADKPRDTPVRGRTARPQDYPSTHQPETSSRSSGPWVALTGLGAAVLCSTEYMRALTSLSSVAAVMLFALGTLSLLSSSVGRRLTRSRHSRPR